MHLFCPNVFIPKAMEYLVVINGKPEGPFSLEDLKKLHIRPDTFLRKPGMDDYKEAHQMKEVREFMGFVAQQTAPQYYASFDQRFLAMALDYFFVILFYVILMLIAYIFMDQKTFKGAIIVVFFAVVPLTKFIYASIAEASEKQATLGKRLVDIKVGDMYGNKLTLFTSIMRNFSKIFSNITIGIGYLYCFTNKKQQCFHDVIAGTLIVKQRLL